MYYQYLRLIRGVEANFASTAFVMPMNRGMQGAGGNVIKTVMKKQQLS